MRKTKPNDAVDMSNAWINIIISPEPDGNRSWRFAAGAKRM